MGQRFSIPKFKLPALVARIGVHLPQWPHAMTLTAGLNAAARMKLLPMDSLQLLEGRSFLRRGAGYRRDAPALPTAQACSAPLFSVPQTPDLSFRANLSAFMQMLARQEDPDTLFFNRELSIEGDTELGLVVKNMLDAVEWPQLPKLPVFSN